jgi:hypothetical protein
VRLVDAATVARTLSVSRDFVYAHADELGARRLGRGWKPRLRFDLDRILEDGAASSDRPERHEAAAPAPLPSTRVRPRTGIPLLPIRGRVG